MGLGPGSVYSPGRVKKMMRTKTYLSMIVVDGGVVVTVGAGRQVTL